MQSGRLQRSAAALLAGLALLVPPRLALADGGCSGCSESIACLWVCTFTFGIFALPVWVVVMVCAALVNPSFRRLRPHVSSFPLAFLGTVLALRWASATPLAFWLFLPVLPLLWYVALAKLPVLRWFTR
jgi:hypothetical protein